MTVMKNKLENVEAKISESYNMKRDNDEDDALEKIKQNSKYFFNYAKKYSKTHDTIGPLIDGKGNIVSESKTMADILMKHYNSVFSKPSKCVDDYVHMDYKCQDMHEITFSSINVKKYISG